MTRQPDDIEFVVRRAGDDPFGDKELRSTQGFTSQDIINAISDVRNGIYASSHGSQFDGDGAWITGAVDLTNKALAPPAFPFFKEDLTRYASNPVITPASVGGGVLDVGNTAADPFLLAVGKVLYCFFEQLDIHGTNLGQIYRCRSVDNGQTWTNFVKCSQDDTLHYHCPMAFVHLGEVHLFFESTGDGTYGALYHQSCSIASFETATPAWGAQTLSLDSRSVGMPHRFTEGTIFQHQGLWYCFVVTGATTATEDRQLYGWWSPTFITDWNTYGQPMTNPILDTTLQSSWLQNFTHPAAMSVGGDTFLMFGIDPTTSGYRGIGVFAITDLSPDRGLTGVWLEKTFMWPLNSDSTAWDGTTIHRAHAVLLNGTWTFIYDGLQNNNTWRLGIATMSARGAPRASNPTSRGEIIRPASYYDAGTRIGAVSSGAGGSVGVRYTSVCGIDLSTGSPIPYFNPAGVTAGDEAVLSFDNATGWPVLTRMVG